VKTLYDSSSVNALKQRIALLKPESKALWGKMNAPQALAHCSAAMETAVGDLRPPRMFIGRVIGPIVKSKVLREPLGRNAPTAKIFVVSDERDLRKEGERLSRLVDRFASAGKAGCTTHPHTFFGRMTADEWGILMYKHIDHHLQQFGV
jgi:hypothetical protein